MRSPKMRLEQPTPVRARDLCLGDYVIDPDGKSTVRIDGIRDVIDYLGTLLHRDFRMRPFRITCVRLSPDTEVPVVMRADEIYNRQAVLFRMSPSWRGANLAP